MAQNILYHEARPMNDAVSFGEFQSIDWEIEDVGRKLLKNSVYIEAELQVFSAGSTLVTIGSSIGTTRDIGHHSLFESWSVEAKSQNIQNIQHYPRYCNIVETGTGNQGTIYTPASQAEGKQVTEEACVYTCQQIKAHAKNAGVAKVSNVQFCIKPRICLNSMAGDGYSFAKNGAIRISTNLARNGAALHGAGVVSDSSYKISKVRLRYITIPDNGSQGAMMMNSVVSIKQSINSQQANLSVKVPSRAVTGVVMNYISQQNETGLNTDSYQLESLPNIDEIQYLFSDSQAQYISYNVTDPDNMMKLGIEALVQNGVKVKANAFKKAGGENVIHGLNFKQTLDLSRQKFGVNIKSSSLLLNTNPRNIYLHFLTIISL